MTDPNPWQDVDDYLIAQLVPEDDRFGRARETSAAAGLPPIEVSPAQGKLLALLCRMIGARRALEFGTLGGYSTLWLADAVGENGRVVSLELEARHAEVARGNLAEAGLGDRVEIVVGPAVESAKDLVAGRTEPFDFVFIDADKPSNVHYLEAAVALTRPGAVIVVDNVVRRGGIIDPTAQDDERIRGSRAVIEAVSRDPRLDGTALQTVGRKGWDGLIIALVR
ncbi:O-methyltransferase [Granulicoccus phenolivorans]|uniref:O-methyltransferase n=1 Tax=Granulicoccus phenolivorans TaxID=266854 RepID=UPI0004149DB5|nr:O-methyltransferase [Granulicoccus phenolivorans]